MFVQLEPSMAGFVRRLPLAGVFASFMPIPRRRRNFDGWEEENGSGSWKIVRRYLLY